MLLYKPFENQNQ